LTPATSTSVTRTQNLSSIACNSPRATSDPAAYTSTGSLVWLSSVTTDPSESFETSSPAKQARPSSMQTVTSWAQSADDTAVASAANWFSLKGRMSTDSIESPVLSASAGSLWWDS